MDAFFSSIHLNKLLKANNIIHLFKHTLNALAIVRKENNQIVIYIYILSFTLLKKQKRKQNRSPFGKVATQ